MTPALDFTTDGDVTASWAGSSLDRWRGRCPCRNPCCSWISPEGGRGRRRSPSPCAHPLSLDAPAADGSGADWSGSVELTGCALDGTFSVDTQVANIVLPAGDGSQATVSGGGSIGLAKAGGAVAYQLQAALDGPVDLFPEFPLTSAGLTWDDTDHRVRRH
ncbi:MAG: hypothetical protein U0R64_05480 [Candidatus Nanopelagicales bacterium]